MNIEEAMAVPMSESDIKKWLGKKTPILLYSQTAAYDTIDEMLGPAKRCVILYELKEHSGHWITIFRYGKRLSISDSLGLYFNSELEYIDKEFAKRSKQHYSSLALLVKNCPYAVEWNNHKLQVNKPGIATCGRHCIIRLMYPQMDADEYAKMLMSNPDRTPDEIVTCALPPKGFHPRR